MAFLRAVMLVAAFAVGTSFAEVRTLPVKASLKGEVLTGTLEILDGTFLTFVVGNDRHPVSFWDAEKAPALLGQLIRLADQEVDNRFVAAPFELTDGFKNASVQNILLTLSIPEVKETHQPLLGTIQIDRVQLDVAFAHRPLDQADLQRYKASVDIETAHPPFAYDRPESYGIAFGDNVLPVRIVEKIEQASTDRHGNPKKEWRARVVPLDEWWSREEKPRLTVLDVPVTSLLFLDQDATDLNVLRVRREGLSEDEAMGVGTYGLGALKIDPKADAVEQVKAFTAGKQADTASIQRMLLQTEQMRRNETQHARDEVAILKEQAEQMSRLLDDYKDIETESREAARKDLEALAPAHESVHEKLIMMLEKYDGQDKKALRESIAEVFKQSLPLPLSTVMGLANESLTPDPQLRLIVEGIFAAANQEKALEKRLLAVLLNPVTAVDQVSAARRALVMCKPSGEISHELLVALKTADPRLRDVAVNTLAELGPFSTDFLMEIVGALKSEHARESAAALLIRLNPDNGVVKEELVRLVKANLEPAKTTAGELLAKLHSSWGWIDDQDVAAFVQHCRNQNH